MIYTLQENNHLLQSRSFKKYISGCFNVMNGHLPPIYLGIQDGEVTQNQCVSTVLMGFRALYSDLKSIIRGIGLSTLIRSAR